MYDAIIVGAGLAGLSCARNLQRQGKSYLLLDAADRVGGRIRTDIVDGFRLDRGFQVFLTSYPEAAKNLDYASLKLQSFLSGALVRFQGDFYEMADPWRRPFAAIKSLRSPIGSFADKWRVAGFRSRALRGTIEARFQDPEMTSLACLERAGFSSSMIDRFFRPFLGGIFLDPELNTSSRMLNFVFRMFSLGTASLPAEGMEAIPRQLAKDLQPSSVRLSCRVQRVLPNGVRLASGEELRSKTVVVAVEGPAAAELLDQTDFGAGQGVTCIYFSAPHPPLDRPLLVLNGDGANSSEGGPINNLCVPTSVAPSYGPGDRSLISITVLGLPASPKELQEQVLQQLHDWYGDQVANWKHLRTYSIPYALPNQIPPALKDPERSVRWQPGIYLCGDHRDNASIQGAMVSGRRASEAVLQDLHDEALLH